MSRRLLSLIAFGLFWLVLKGLAALTNWAWDKWPLWAWIIAAVVIIPLWWGDFIADMWDWIRDLRRDPEERRRVKRDLANIYHELRMLRWKEQRRRLYGWMQDSWGGWRLHRWQCPSGQYRGVSYPACPSLPTREPPSTGAAVAQHLRDRLSRLGDLALGGLVAVLGFGMVGLLNWAQDHGHPYPPAHVSTPAIGDVQARPGSGRPDWRICAWWIDRAQPRKDAPSRQAAKSQPAIADNAHPRR
jgi:hypothetical protein